MECRACGSHEYSIVLKARERMFETDEQFDYFECADCRSLQITKIPSNIEHHYPNDYYSIARTAQEIEAPGRIRRFLRAARINYTIGGVNPVGRLVQWIAPEYIESLEWFRGRVSTKSRLLDVGCGRGDLLRSLRVHGFRDLTGIDPFVDHEVTLEGLSIKRGELRDLSEKQFDFIMLHHSLEHMVDPVSGLQEVARLLRPDGSVLVRIPVAGTYPARRYGIDWIGLDPPRHLFVPSRVGMSELAQRAGFVITGFWYDASAWTLLASETMARGLSYYDRERKKFIVEEHFTSQEIDAATARAATLNSAGDGDTACFILRA